MKTRGSFEQLIVTVLLAALVLLPTSGFLLFSDTISGIVHQPLLLLCSKQRSCKSYGNSSHPRSSPLIKIMKPVRSKPADSLCANTQGISKLEITPELVRKAAELSQIQVTDEEVPLLVPRMEEFIGFVETMEEVGGSSPIDDTFGRSDTFGATFLREDTINKFCNVEAVMENMPLEEGNYLRVPRVGQDDE